MDELWLNLNATPKKLTRVRNNISYLNRQLHRMKSLDRKQDTRRKIQLGGLIKKVGLDMETTAVLFGMLLDCKEKLSGDDAIKFKNHWQIKGDLALTEEQCIV